MSVSIDLTNAHLLVNDQHHWTKFTPKEQRIAWKLAEHFPGSYLKQSDLKNLGNNTEPNSLKDENNTIEASTNKTL